MAVVSKLPLAEFGRNDHREHIPLKLLNPMIVSVYMLALLSIDRYVAIVLSTKRTKFFNTLRKIRKSVCAINLVSMSFISGALNRIHSILPLILDLPSHVGFGSGSDISSND